jgi:four helix bundle protein
LVSNSQTSGEKRIMAFIRFQDLSVYQRSEELADSVWTIVRKWDILARDTVGKQLIRAADSIGANIAEGSGRQSHVDNRRFIRIARGSLHETQHWLRRAFRRKLLSSQQTNALQATVKQLGPQLNGYLNSIARKSVKRTPKTPNTKH